MRISSTIHWFMLAAGMYALFFILGTEMGRQACGSLHSSMNVACWLSTHSPEICGILGGAVFGWKRQIVKSTLAMFVPIIGLIFVWFSGYLGDWYGTDIWWSIRSGLVYTVLFAFLASLVIAYISSRLRTSAL